MTGLPSLAGSALAPEGDEIAGASGRWILTRHMVPNTLGISVVTATFSIADSIYALSALSFLGIGPPPPFTDWGTMRRGGAAGSGCCRCQVRAPTVSAVVSPLRTAPSM
jgi:ABC-type dipeptide/oligopeptide/nickel transport system permease subunit